jgi:hypothetical protein
MPVTAHRTKTARAATAATQQQQTAPPLPSPTTTTTASSSSLRDTWAHRLLSRVSLAAQSLEEIEQSKRKKQQQQGEHGDEGNDNNDNDVGAVLDRIFEDELEPIFMSRGGYRIPPRERRELDASGGSATYGEVLPEGVRTIARQALALDAAVALSQAENNDNNNSNNKPVVFVDLGCGTGRAVMQVAGEFPGVERAVGVELGATRLEQAEMALDLLQEQREQETAAHRPPLAPVEFRLEDLAHCDLSATGGTHFYACTTAFSAALCRSLAERLANATPSFRVLVTTRALPAQPHLRLVGKSEGVHYSWTTRGSAYVYVRSAEEAPAEVLARLWGGGGGGAGAVALPSVLPLAMVGLVTEEPMVAAMEAAAVRRGEDDDDGGH